MASVKLLWIYLSLVALCAAVDNGSWLDPPLQEIEPIVIEPGVNIFNNTEESDGYGVSIFNHKNIISKGALCWQSLTFKNLVYYSYRRITEIIVRSFCSTAQVILVFSKLTNST